MPKLHMLILIFFYSSCVFGQEHKDSLKIFSLDGGIIATGYYVKGDKKNGTWVYYKGESILKIENWKNGELYGFSYTMHTSGTVSQVLYFEENKLNGKALFYSSQGTLLAIYGYINNVLTTFEYYTPDKESPPYKRDFIPSL